MEQTVTPSHERDRLAGEHRELGQVCATNRVGSVAAVAIVLIARMAGAAAALCIEAFRPLRTAGIVGGIFAGGLGPGSCPSRSRCGSGGCRTPGEGR